MNDKNEYHNER